MKSSTIVRNKDFIVDGKILLDKKNIKALSTLVRTIIKRHFLEYPERYYEDFYSIGLTKACQLILQGSYDPTHPRKYKDKNGKERVSYPSLQGYLYTGIRNDIGNYINRQKSEGSEEDLQNLTYSEEKEDLRGLFISSEFVSRLEFDFGFDRNVLLTKLYDLGFEIEPEFDKTRTEEDYSEIMAYIIWKLQED